MPAVVSKVTGENGIAIGKGAEAGANQIRIGANTVTDVEVGKYNLATITTNIAAGIAANRDDIEINRSGIAMSVALSNLPTVKGPKGGWSLALGSFESETAIAAGVHYNVGTNGTIKIGVANSSGGSSGGIGFGMGF